LLADGDRLSAAAERLGAGALTLRDAAQALCAPGRDARAPGTLAALRFTQSLALEALAPGMELDGIVRNVADFGAFVDINATLDGLVHVSEFRRGAGREGGGRDGGCRDWAAVGQRLRVRVLAVDLARRRLSLAPAGEPASL
jgi:uncharacterized protein